MIDVLSHKLTNQIKNNFPEIDEQKAEIINFGIQSIISEISKTIIILTVAYFLGVLNLILTAIVVFGMYRTFAGGFHAKSNLACLLTNSMLFFSIVYLSVFLEYYLEFIYIMIYLFNCYVIYFYAPADVEQKPILSKKLRKKLKIKSFVVMSLIFILSLIIYNRILTNILILATLFESITLLPISYKIMDCKHGVD